MKKSTLLASIALVATLAGCRDKGIPGLQEQYMVEEDAAVSLGGAESRQSRSAKMPAGNEAPEISPKIIRTANVSMEVVDYDRSKRQIDSIVAASGAFVVGDGFQQTDAQRGSNMEIKVPAPGFGNLLKSLTAVAKRVDYQNVYTQDVTEEYIDVKTRMEHKRRVERTYLALLRRATSVEEILQIENKLGEIRAEIESAEGRMRYINRQVDLSTVSLYFYQKLDFKYTPEEQPGFWQRAKEALHMGWKGIVWVLVFFMRIWPLWVIAATAYLIWWFVAGRKPKGGKKKRKDRKRKVKADGGFPLPQEVE